MTTENWDDLRYVIAVAETGTVSGAARLLGVTHGTVLRRVAAFETRHGGPLFARSANGYTVLPEKNAVIEAAQDVANAVQAVGRLLGGAQSGLRGTVRITSTDTLCQTVLPIAVRELCLAYPDLTISLVSTNAHLDIIRSAADITVRPATRLPDGLEGQEVAKLAFGVYAAKDYPIGPDAKWLTLDGPLSRTGPASWMADSIPPTQCAAGSDSFMALLELAAFRTGITYLPCILAAKDPRLQRIRGIAPDFTTGIWVACQPEMSASSRLTVVRKGLETALTPFRASLADTQ